MRPALVLALVALLLIPAAHAQEEAPERRSWFNRILHPQKSEPLPDYKDPRLRGLVLSLQLSPQPVKLSEVRRLDVKLTLSNQAKRAIELGFQSTQRIEIYLRNSAEEIIETWSDNHAFENQAANVLINPQEHIEYAETIATRDLTPNKVFIAEVFFPEHPELNIRQKFLTAP